MEIASFLHNNTAEKNDLGYFSIILKSLKQYQ